MYSVINNKKLVSACKFQKNKAPSVIAHGILLTGLALIPLVHAQTPPDAGSVLQQIERDRVPQRVPTAPNLSSDLPPEPMKAKKGLSIEVKQFEFVGNTLLSSVKLQELVKSYVGKKLDFNQLQEAVTTVSKAYSDAGWVAQVYLPKQEINNGIIKIQIVEAVFGKLIIEGDAKRIPKSLVEQFVNKKQQSGSYLNAAEIDAALLMVNEIPGAVVEGGLQQGAKQSETDFRLVIKDGPLYSGDVTVDNTGSRATGAERIAINGYLFSPLKKGDMVMANVFHTQGSNYVRLSYTQPVGGSGLRMGVNSSLLNFEVISPELLALAIQGESKTVGLEASYPLIRSRSRYLSLLANLDQKDLHNTAAGVQSSDYRVQVMTVGASGYQLDSYYGGGMNTGSVTLSYGKLNLGGIDSGEDNTLPRSYTKLRAALAREQTITPRLSLFASASLQISNDNLDSSEKFFLGGASGVRAYPAAEGGGASGQLISLEARTRVRPDLMVAPFYDWGSVMVNPNNATGQVGSVAALNSFKLMGVGVYAVYTGLNKTTLKAIWSHRTLSSPIKNATTGFDGDGSLVTDRLWLTASYAF